MAQAISAAPQKCLCACLLRAAPILFFPDLASKCFCTHLFHSPALPNGAHTLPAWHCHTCLMLWCPRNATPMRGAPADRFTPPALSSMPPAAVPTVSPRPISRRATSLPGWLCMPDHAPRTTNFNKELTNHPCLGSDFCGPPKPALFHKHEPCLVLFNEPHNNRTHFNAALCKLHCLR